MDQTALFRIFDLTCFSFGSQFDETALFSLTREAYCVPCLACLPRHTVCLVLPACLASPAVLRYRGHFYKRAMFPSAKDSHFGCMVQRWVVATLQLFWPHKLRSFMQVSCAKEPYFVLQKSHISFCKRFPFRICYIKAFLAS